MADDFPSFDGSIPEHYDQGLGPVFFQDYGADLSKQVAALAPSNVLELASGTGIVTRQLRDHLPAESAITATDLSPDMMAISKPKFGAGDNITFQQADACDLPFDDNSFDAIACQFGIMFFPDKAQSLREAHRVLKPGGTYVFNVWDTLDVNPVINVIIDTLSRHISGDPPTFFQIPFGYNDVEEITTTVRQAGFADVSVEILPINKSVSSAAPFANGLVKGNPAVEEFKAGGADPDQLAGALEEGLMATFGSNPTVVPMQAIRFIARAS